MIIQSLCGSWELYALGEEKRHAAAVPGSVYSCLIGDGSMPDPYYRDNELDAFELLRKDWVFERSFTVSDELLSCRHVLLCCEGLDTLATLFINGEKLADANNMHIRWEWELRPFLRAGENSLRVVFHSPIEYCLKEGEKYPAWHSTDAIPGYPRLRKAACMFGWDWGPRLPDAGIWRPISLKGYNDCRLGTSLIQQFHENGGVRLRVQPEISGDSSDAKVSILLTDPDGVSTPLSCVNGTGEICIAKPQLWWPNGYGAQPLYTVTVCLQSSRDREDAKYRIGLRKLDICREKDAWGESFCHIVNGVKVFAMGGDYIPEDCILSRMTPERTRRLLEDAALAHYNVIRVWGGGHYPSDAFYDICDELGLMVWQDLAYACAYYDLDDAFEQSIILETRQNVERLRHHASLALLCGNNEMESFQKDAMDAEQRGDYESFGPVRPSHHTDYVKMFEYLLPKAAKAAAPQTFYWPASPSSGGCFDDPNSPDRGDTHYWGVWHGEKPFTEYRKYFFRYASEFGFQSFPCLPTVESFTLPEDRNIFSRIMERHQRNKAANGKILSYLSQTFRYPYSFDGLLYLSQLLQAEAIRYGVEHWRRNRGRCMGAVIWQLNDCWPVASWSSIDYYGRWKALHYAAKRFFAPVMISACEEGETTQNPCINEFLTSPIEKSVRLCVANETLSQVQGRAEWELRLADGSVLKAEQKEISVAPLTSLWLDKEEFPEASLTGCYVSYRFVMDEIPVSEGSVLFCAPKHFEFRDPRLSVKAQGNRLVLHAESFAKAVYIQSDDPDLLLEDNFFDMQPGERHIQVLRGEIQKGLRVRSVFNPDENAGQVL